MKQIRKINILLSGLLVLSFLLSGCTKEIERVKAPTAEEAIQLFNQYNMENNIEEMIKLYSDTYVDYVGYTTDQIYKIIDANRKDVEIKNSQVISIEEIDENVKKAIISITSVVEEEEVTEEYTYGILKEGDGWAVSPDGIIQCINFDIPMAEEKELNLNLAKEAIQFDGAIVKINVYNDSNNVFVFGDENNKTEVIVETTEGTYKSTLEESVVVPKRSKSYFMAKIEDVKGDIKKVVVTSVFDGDDEENPVSDTMRDIEVYNK